MDDGTTVSAAAKSKAPETRIRAEFPAFEVRRIQPHLGAELSGFDLTGPLSDSFKSALRALWLEHRVLFCRGQNIDHARHLELARLFGAPVEYPGSRGVEGYPGIVGLSSDDATADAWHSDLSWQPQCATAIVLRSRVLPPLGGDTIWADAHRAYETLPDDIKARIENLYAIHDYTGVVSKQRADLPGHAERVARAVALRRRNPLVAHPIVRTHPETGRKTLYVNEAFTTMVVGLEKSESDALLARLFRQFLVPEHQIRFRWTPDTVALWDNRATIHYAVYDYGEDKRYMERVTVRGEEAYW